MLNAAAFAVPALTRFRAHEHESTHVCVVLAGGFIERDGKSWRDLGPGTVRVSGGARHDIDFSAQGARCLVMEIPEESIGDLQTARFFANDPQLISLSHRIAETTDEPLPLRSAISEHLTTEFIAQLQRRIAGRAMPAPPWLERIRELVNDSAGRVPVSDLARSVGVHRVHLARVFRDHFGISLTRYQNRLRVQAALRLLRTNQYALSDVAARAGYADQSHLTRALRAEIGATPGSVRRMLHPFKT